MTDVSRLFEFGFSGRAVLVSGQDLEPGTSRRLRELLLKQLALPPHTSLEDACTSLSDPAPIVAATGSIGELGSAFGLRRIAEVPWAAVFTSALDDTLSAELASQDSQGRRLRHLCVNDEMPAFFPRRNDVLTVLHLSHLANEQTTTGLPLYGRHWGRAKRFFIPGVLRDLPQAVGPAHLLCIAGIGASDIVEPNLVADFASALDPDNVYWFVAPEDGLDLERIKRLVPTIHFIESGLVPALASHLDSTRNDLNLSARKEQVLDLQDLAVTVDAGDTQRILTFRASELREFRRHLVIVPDLKTKAPPSELSKRKREFISFLSENRQTPDWNGMGEGYAFQRDAYSKLLDVVNERVRVIRGSGPRLHSQKTTVENVPIFLSGPPASGRTIGLLWLAYQLRRRAIFVVHLLPSGGMVNNGSIEQILRLAEGRGAPATVALLDRADRKVAENLDRHLRSAGRRSVVVASVAPEIPRRKLSGTADLDEEEGFLGAQVPLEYVLTETEAHRFRAYLVDNYGEVDADLVLRLLALDPSVFALLYRLIPDTRENIRAVLVNEYLSLVEGLASFRPPRAEHLRGGTLSGQLRVWLASRKRQPVESEEGTPAAQPGPWHNIATQLPQLVLLFSGLDEPISLNLLTRRFPGLLQAYGTLRESLENSGLFLEVALDKENDIGLTAVNPLVAQLLLNAAVPSSVARINLLAALLYEFPWDPGSRPVNSPEQALLIHVIRSISSPSGSFQSEYQRTEDLRALAEVLRRLREDHSALLPQLLLLEGIVVRHIGRRLGDDNRNSDALALYRRSRTVLETARDILSRRRPSPGRNFEMSTVLTAMATTIGHTSNAESRAQGVSDSQRRDLVQSALDTAGESQAYAQAYHPLDTAFWTSRDFYKYLLDRPDTEEVRSERQQALLNMAGALDKAGELGELPHDQADRLGGRIVELTAYLHDIDAAQLRAEEEAKVGRFSGICLMARLRAIDSRTNGIVSAEQADAALRYLEGYAPRILNDDRALTLMHRLWVGAHLGNHELDEGPYAIRGTQQDWRQLEGIASARRVLAGNTRIPYVNFWLAVALAQQGDMRRALQMLQEVQANSLAFSHRRLTPLVYLSEERGVPKRFGAIVRRRDEDDLLTVYVPVLGIEVKISKRYQGTPAMINVQRGDETAVLVALNYWNPVGIGPTWEDAQAKGVAQPSSQDPRGGSRNDSR